MDEESMKVGLSWEDHFDYQYGLLMLVILSLG